MKSQVLSTAVFAGLISQVSSSPLHKRAGELIGYGAGTTGGAGGAVTTVTSCSALEAAVAGTGAKIVRINGMLSGCGIIDVDSNTSIFGTGASSGVANSGFRVRQGTNVIFQNLKLGPAPSKGDLIALDESTKIWIDHCDFQSVGMTGGKDDYDGLLDATHAADMITVSWNKFHDHWKGSLVGHSDSNAGEDTGKLHITYHHNLWENINSRLPSLRFGTGHVFNSHFINCPTSGINSRMGAQVLVENNVFDNVKLAMVTDLDSDEEGSICDVGNVLTGTSTTRITQQCNLTPPYSYSLDSASSLASILASGTGTGVIAP